MKIKKTKDVETPLRSTSGSAGIDFFVPNSIKEYIIKPHEDINIPSGIKVELKPGTALLAVNKSGVATKSKLSVGACLIDEDYTGEIHLHVYNYSDQPQRIFGGQKLVQFLLINYIKEDIEVVENIKSIQTERGDKGFGSTQSEQIIEPQLKGTTATLIKKDAIKQSKGTGTYQTLYFKDIENETNYLLYMNHQSWPIFHNLKVGDTLTNLSVGANGKINGRCNAQLINLKKNQLKGIEL